MPATQQVKHAETQTALRETSKNSHIRPGIVVKTTFGTRFQKMGDSIHVSNINGVIEVDAIKLVSRLCSIESRPTVRCLLLIGNREVGQIFISQRDFHSLFHAFAPEINDRLNVLSTSEEDVIATGSDQEPVAGTNNANIRG